MTGIFRKLLDVLPRREFFDSVVSLALFFRAHGRLPKRSSGLFNDYLFYRKIGSASLDVLVQFTSDKILMKEYVRIRNPKARTIDTLAVFCRSDKVSVDPTMVPCVLKPAHGSGSVVFCSSPDGALPGKDIATLRKSLSTSPYITNRERNYKYLRRRIVCEPMLPTGIDTVDYKVFCFKGLPRAIQVDSDRHTSHRRNLYSTAWDELGLTYNFPRGDTLSIPTCLPEMLEVSRSLAEDFDFVRVDFFISDGTPYVGELTHCPESSHGRFASRFEEMAFSKILFSKADA